MRFKIAFTTLLLIILCFHAYGQQWTQIDDYPADPRDDGTSFTIGNTAWCGTGVTGFFEIRRDFFAFDMEAETWQAAPSMYLGQERQYAVGFAHDNYGYVFGGINSSGFLNDLWLFDPLNGIWVSKPALPAAGRSGASGFVIGNDAYIIGGKNQDAEALNEVWAYNILNDNWSQKDDLPFGGRWRASSVSIGGMAYLLFGRDETGRFCNEIYSYDPEEDIWTFIGNFPGLGRNYVDTRVLDDKIICFGGNDTLGVFHNDFWRYDPATTSWNQLPSLPAEGRRGGMGFTDGQTFYYSSGMNDSFERLPDTWKIDQVTSVLNRSGDHQVKIYPNPIRDVAIVEINSLKSNARLELYDWLGRLCYTKILVDLRSTLDITALAPGIYLVRIDDRHVEKLVKY